MSAAGAGLLRSSATFILDKITVLRLYKDLLRYSSRLQFTDKSYYLNRVRTEFRNNQSLSKSEEIQFYYNVNMSFGFCFNHELVFCFHLQKGVAFLSRQRLV